MKYGVIDVGSNSVRLMMYADGKTLYKDINTTRLGEGLSFSDVLKTERIELTANAIAMYVEKAKNENADKIMAFATAAVRTAKNGADLVKRVYQLSGIALDVISGETEAEIGLLGAIGNKDGGIIDIGGASTEITVKKDGKTVYSKSLDIGTVRLLDICGQNRLKAEETVREKIKEYGLVPETVFYCIGGTATTIAAINLRLKVYNPKIVNKSVITLNQMESIRDKLCSLTPEERKKVDGVEAKRAEVIGGGSILMTEIMKYLKVSQVIVSEDDNLEGYLLRSVSEL